MGFPYIEPSEISGGVSLPAVSSFLRSQFPGRFMIWNLSERTYDYAEFDNQVIEFRFPG